MAYAAPVKAKYWDDEEVNTAQRIKLLLANQADHQENTPVKRDEFVSLMISALELAGQTMAPVKNSPFTDVAGDEMFKDSIDKAVASGFISGYPDGSFQPNKPISKEEMAIIVSRVLKLKDTEALFEDISKSSKYAGEVGAAVKDGIIQGESGKIYGRGRAVNEIEASVIALRIYKKQPFNIMDATINEIQAAMETGKITSKQLVQMYLDRIQAYDHQGPKLNAILTINPHVLDEAGQFDAERKQTKSRGPLYGIPIILKDNYNTKEMPTTGGTAALKGFTPADDAFAVKKLRDAGAIILGKANLHELALSGTTISSLGGQTLNPYDLTKTPGGSSGGTADSVTANFAVAGTGSDTVNSVRSPASADNLVGIRPTKGLVSIDGIVPVSFTQDEAGPIARTVEDAAIMLDAMRGFDPNDSYTALSLGHIPVKLTSSLDKNGLKGKRIGILQNFFGNQPVHDEVNLVTNEAIKEMEGLGATLVPITVPNLDTDQVVKDYDVQKYEIKTVLNQYFSKYGTPVKSLEELLAIGQIDPSIANTLKTAQSIDSPLEQPDYKARLAKMENLKKQMLQVLNDNHLDALLYPHQKRLVVDTGGASQADRNGILASVTGFPAITFQGGFSTPTDTAPIGVPVGIELLGKPFSEPALIQMAYGFEKGTDHRRMPLSTPALK
ncbi:amidase family protein [Paenibacillus solisilvae]|uniref:Amidase family protein n=1 Tax=Paenibacillus solisilvae TaxID=2486751 RepID=A0ABW0VWK0_9BACL